MKLPKKRVAHNLAKLGLPSAERQWELDEIQRHAIAGFSGQVTTLETAIGMLQLGDHVGWRALAIIHSPRTLRKYEDILGIKVREFFPEEGKSADRSYGYRAAMKLKNFWKAVTGEEKVERKQEIA